jgi:hypothetical protein
MLRMLFIADEPRMKNLTQTIVRPMIGKTPALASKFLNPDLIGDGPDERK